MAENVDEKPRRRRRRRSEEAEEVIEDADRSMTEAKGRATPGRRSRSTQAASEQGNALTRPFRGVIEYFKGVSDELRKVTWPTREDLQHLTVMTLIVTILSSIALGIVALIYTELFIFGLTQGNEWVFIVVFVAVIALAFAFSRFNAGGGSDSPY